MSKPYLGPSDSQSNAEALARRGAPFSGANRASATVAYDYRRREPRDLRDAVRLVRRAYADEVPDDLHEKGEDGIGEDGTPKWTARAAGYIFGRPDASDAKRDPETKEWDAISYYYAPFRATLDVMAAGDEVEQRRAAIIGHITIGAQGPYEAAVAEKAHPFDAKLVAWDALCSFLRQLSDMRVDTRHVPLAEGYTAA